MRLLLILTGCLILLLAPLGAVTPLGGFAGTFLRVPGDPVEGALGMTTVARVGDPLCLDRNPASLAALTKITADFGYNHLAQSRQSFYLVAALPVLKDAVIGLRWRNQSVNGMDRRDIFGNTDGRMSNSENLIAISVARSIGANWQVGAGAEYAQQNIDNLSAFGVAGNLGVLWLPSSQFTFGAAAGHLGLQYKWDATTYYTDGTVYDQPIPFETRLGAAYHPWHWATLSGEASGLWGIDRNEVRWGLGAETLIEEVLFTRVGIYRTYAQTYWGAGLGLQWHFKDFLLRFDYSFSPGSLGSGMEHRTGIRVVIE